MTKPRIPDDGTVSAWHQYVVRHPRRDDLRAWLARGGVGTEIHYPVACHRQKCYEGTPLSRSRMPVAERLAGEILSPPIADVSPGEAQRVACLINSFENQQSR